MMKMLLTGLFVLGSVSSFAADKILECEAIAKNENGTIFEIQADVYDRRVNSQGSTIIDYTKNKESVVTKLIIDSNDKFKDHFSVYVSHKVGREFVEKDALENLSLKESLKEYGITKKFGDYQMDLSCVKK